MRKYLYYPGCSLKSSARHYEESILSVFHALEISLVELSDWNCCGATACMAMDRNKAVALAARNLALAERQGEPNDKGEVHLLVPCAACFLGLYKAQKYLEDYEDIAETVIAGLRDVGLDYSGNVRIRHPLDVLVNDFGVENIRHKVSRKLVGLRVACYYGCQLVRPYAVFDDQANPTTKEQLMETLGAEIVDWHLPKTRCCGSSVTGIMNDIGLPLSYNILEEAHRHGANIVATSCPLCQFNLECYQVKMRKKHGDIDMPVAFFTQLIGLALGLDRKALGLHRLFIPVEPLLAKTRRD